MTGVYDGECIRDKAGSSENADEVSVGKGWALSAGIQGGKFFNHTGIYPRISFSENKQTKT